MKDIDFDELDKAVNSLMATTPKSEPEVETPASPVAESVAPMPSSDARTEQGGIPDSPASEPVAVRTATPAARRSGRFMDMVSTPSDQQRALRPTSVPSVSTSREGLAITPRVDEPSTRTQPDPIDAVPLNQTVSMPDPIEFAGPSVEPEQTTPEDQPQTQPDEVIAQQLGSLESPFLTDAKVEKRPLNAGATEPIFVDLGAELASEKYAETSGVGEQSDVSSKESDEPPFNPQVAEYSDELVSVESDENEPDIQVVDTADAAREIEPPSTPLGASSIAQQYTPQPSTGDQSHAAIYDSSQYPEPITHPAKGKSGWLWILWVVLLLGIGAGGAVVLYNLGIIP